MKQIYAHYSTLPTSSFGGGRSPSSPSSPKSGGGVEDIFYLNQGQLWTLCEDCGIISQSLTLANLARIISIVKIQFAQSIAIARRRREAQVLGVDEDLTPTVDDRLYLEVSVTYCFDCHKIC
jgi:hypothetical protein